MTFLGNFKQKLFSPITIQKSSFPQKLVDFENKFKIIFDNIDEVVFFLDQKGKIIDVNNKIDDVFGFRAAEVIGKNFSKSELLNLNSLPQMVKIFSDFIKDGKIVKKIELELLDKYNNEVKVEITAIPIEKENKIEGQILIIKDITKEKEIKKKQTEGASGLEFLSEMAMSFIEFPVKEDIYSFIGKQLRQLVPESFIIISSVEGPGKLKVRAVLGPGKRRKTGVKILGYDPEGMLLKMGREAEFMFTRGRLMKVEGGLHKLTYGKIPKFAALAVETALGLGEMYVMGFFWKGKLFGDVVIILKKRNQLTNQGIIETFINQASVALQRKKAEDELQETLKRVENEKEKVSREKDKTEAILYGIGDAVCVIDRDYQIAIFNQAAADISGFKPQEVIGKNYLEVLKLVDEKTQKPIDNYIKETILLGEIKKMPADTVLIRKDGSQVPVADSSAPLKDNQGKVIGCVIVFHDVSQERAVDRAKSEFVSLASHQLRTPLSIIKWYAEMVLSGDVGKLAPDQENYIREIYESNQRMIELVNALLNVSRIELGTLAVEPREIDLVETADSVLKEFLPEIGKKKLSVEKDFARDLPKIYLDANLIRIIFQNLISNSIKYTPSQGRISLEIKVQKPNFLIRVSDSGFGIPKDQQSKVFTKLFRADNIIKRETSGTGLGLYLVKSIVEVAEGKIWFESIENKGTTFYITLPLKGMKKIEGSKGLTAGKFFGN